MKNPKSFEEGLARLEDILAQISDDSTPLAKSMQLYAEAADLMAYCSDTLQKAQLQMEEIDARLAGSLPQEASDGPKDV